ncbi:gustatory receptor 8a [Musca vetustissima]|uniref:gustatory receptor 8a n=1 Tax=Musca vetustissima TaxID=27455 RepID=UPI002AB76A00|nr:gustatory receptor 8a [Musca vetustissima]
MIVFNIISYVALFGNDDFLFNGDKFGYFNDSLKIIFGDMAVTCSYLEAIIKRVSVHRFWAIYKQLQQNHPNIGGGHNANREFWLQEIRKNRRFLITFYIVAIIEIGVMLIFFGLQNMTRHLILFWSVFVPFIFIVHLRNMQFIFYIELIRQELVKLQQDLSLMVDYSRFQAYGVGFRGFECFLRTKIAEKQRTYQLIYDMYEHFQNSFGFSIIAVLLMIYVRVLVDSYFGYYTVYRGWNPIELVLLIPAFMQIPMFLIFSKNCMDVVKFITLNLHSIISQFNNQNTCISLQLQNFSLQILHQHICINGVGIARMDGYMLTRAVGSITTYMIFFIQFMPKFTNN